MVRHVGGLTQEAEDSIIWRRVPFHCVARKIKFTNEITVQPNSALQCGHFPLNSYLHRIKKAELNRCMACYKDRDHEGNPHSETINHFIFACTAYNTARNELIRKIGQDHFHLNDMLSNIDQIKALTTYTQHLV
jgi:hypothetical protein